MAKTYKNSQYIDGAVATKGNVVVAAPLHKQIYELIRKPICTGVYPPGSQIPSESEFIHKYGVSRVTVRRAFQDLMAQGLIEGRQGQGTFVRQGAGILATHRYVFIHSTQSSTTYPYTHMLLEGILSLSQNFEFRLELLGLPFREQRPETDVTVSDFVKSAEMSGIITLAGRLTQAEIKMLAENKVPVVFVGYQKFEVPQGMTSVLYNPDEPYKLMLSHLKEIDRKRIGFIGSPKEFFDTDLGNFKRHIEKMKLQFFENACESAELDLASAKQACIRLLRRCPDLDAIVASDDRQASGVLDAVREMEKRIPEDIAVCGIGNFLEEKCHFELTTVDVKLVEQGRLAAQALGELVAGKEVPHFIYVKPQLIRRQSTGNFAE
jgi:DNA-binding LacI/PurR family transcriptional regulator